MPEWPGRSVVRAILRTEGSMARITRRTFLVGLAATTVLAPLAARAQSAVPVPRAVPTPPEIPGGTFYSIPPEESLRKYGEWVKMSDILVHPSTFMYGPSDIDLGVERFTSGLQGVRIAGEPGLGSEYGFVAWRRTWSSAMVAVSDSIPPPRYAIETSNSQEES